MKYILFAIMIFSTRISFCQEVIKITSIDTIKGQTYFCSGIDTVTGSIHKGFPIDFWGSGKKPKLIGMTVTKQRNTNRRRTRREFIFVINR